MAETITYIGAMVAATRHSPLTKYAITYLAVNSGAMTIGGYTITVTGNTTLNDWFNQSVKSTASPTFVAPVLGDLKISGTAIYHATADTSGTYFGGGGSYNSGAYSLWFGGSHSTGAKQLWHYADRHYFRNQASTSDLFYHDGSNFYVGTGAACIYGALYLSNSTTDYIQGNGSITYGTHNISGNSKNGYYGISIGTGLVYLMYDSSGNGGLYDATTYWHLYWNRANTCLGVGGTTTSANYKLYVNGHTYTAGDFVASGSFCPGNQNTYYVYYSSGNICANTNLYSTNDIYAGAMPGTTGYAKVMLVSGWLYYESSSENTKDDITRDWKNPDYKNFLNLKPIHFKPKARKHPDGTDMLLDPVEPYMIGFSLEEVAAVGLPGLIAYNTADGSPMALRDYGFTAYHHLIIQDHENEIKLLKDKVKAIEEKIK